MNIAEAINLVARDVEPRVRLIRRVAVIKPKIAQFDTKTVTAFSNYTNIQEILAGKTKVL
jgi:hypothetical protein